MSRYEDVLGALCDSDPRVVVMTAENRAAIRGLPARLGPRFIDVGICEQTMVGMAAGLALRGRVPVVHALATFLTMRAFEFIRTDVGIAGLPVKLVGAVAGFLSDANGPTHQAIEDVSLMRGIPGMQIVCPSDEEELAAALPAIIASAQPCYVRAVTGAPDPRLGRSAPFKLGQALRLREGRHVTLLSYGHLVGEVAGAADALTAAGISAGVLHLRSLVPLDEAAVLAAARETLLVTIEDHFVTGGLFSIVAELLARRGVRARVCPIALPGRWFRPALLPAVLETEGFTAAALARRVTEILAPTGDAPREGVPDA
jgi:transketolase